MNVYFYLIITISIFTYLLFRFLGTSLKSRMETELNELGFFFNEEANFYEKEGKLYSIVDENESNFFIQEVQVVKKKKKE